MRRAVPSLLRTIALFLASWQAARAGAVSGADSRGLGMTVLVQPIASGASLGRFSTADSALNTASAAALRPPSIGPDRPLLDRGSGLARDGTARGSAALTAMRGVALVARGDGLYTRILAPPIALWLLGGNRARAPCWKEYTL